VLSYDDKSNTYKLSRWTTLKFQYPFNETYNNKLLNTFNLQGLPQGDSSYRFRFFGGDIKAQQNNFLGLDEKVSAANNLQMTVDTGK
jgi:hypothetical protein